METRGIRNNNPLNIEYRRANNWVGRVKNPADKKDSRFEEFDTMEHGLRAAILLLQGYIKRGFNTVPEIIGRWCPPAENGDEATAQYVNFVMKRMKEAAPHFTRHTIIEWHDAHLLGTLLRAMALMESNYAIGDSLLLAAWQSAFDKCYSRRKRKKNDDE